MMTGRVFFASLFFFFAFPGVAFAHGFGTTTDIPLPSWLYLFGINAVVLATFVMIALSFDEPEKPKGYPRRNLLRTPPLRAILTNETLLFGVRLVSVGLFTLTLLAGFFGVDEAGSNFAPTFFWVCFWVGMSFSCALVGNVWPLMNPWRNLFSWTDTLVRRTGAKNGLSLGLRYPPGLAAWPAVALFVGFVWFETVFEGSSAPSAIAFFLALYSVVMWLGMAAFGRGGVDEERGCVFGVFRRPLALRPDRGSSEGSRNLREVWFLRGRGLRRVP